MKPLDFEKFENKNNWRVVHDADNQLYFLKNDNGNKKPGVYTTRIFAEQALYAYLEAVTEQARKFNNSTPKIKKDGRANPRKKQLTPGKDRAIRI